MSAALEWSPAFPTQDRAEREAMIIDLLPMVRRCAIHVAARSGGHTIDELMSDGYLGLLRAVDRFDGSLGVPIKAYAKRCIMGSIYNALRKRFPVSERAHRIYRQAQKRRHELAQERGEIPTLGEMEQLYPKFRAARVAQQQQYSPSFDSMHVDGWPLREIFADASAPDPGEVILESERASALRDALTLLPDRERRLLEMSYSEGYSLHEIARMWGISPQRVSQLHVRALGQLRDALAPMLGHRVATTF